MGGKLGRGMTASGSWVNIKAGSEGKELFSEASAQCTYARLQLEHVE
jgi:hypothetical protein